jgi:hypothetical protein
MSHANPTTCVESCSEINANVKLRASGLMLGVLQQGAPTAGVARKFVLRFASRADLLHCVALLRDCGARVSGDAPPANESAPTTAELDIKPQLSSFVPPPPPPMHLKDATSAENNSSQQWWAGTQPGANGTAPNLVEQQSSGGNSLKRKQSSSMDDPFEGFENMNGASQVFGLIDENAPPNNNKMARHEQQTPLHQRIAAVLSAPDFESKLAAVERALASVIQRDSGARRRWLARGSSN